MLQLPYKQTVNAVSMIMVGVTSSGSVSGVDLVEGHIDAAPVLDTNSKHHYFKLLILKDKNGIQLKGLLAQSGEHSPVTGEVTGSKPV